MSSQEEQQDGFTFLKASSTTCVNRCQGTSPNGNCKTDDTSVLSPSVNRSPYTPHFPLLAPYLLYEIFSTHFSFCFFLLLFFPVLFRFLARRLFHGRLSQPAVLLIPCYFPTVRTTTFIHRLVTDLN
ncbi:UNVERIFIED_CONTAM: hypothetical protein K2H54_041844 [Gekko kuhli]